MDYFFVGIKGSGMASLASIIKSHNHNVSGSDIEQHIFTQDILDAHDIKYYPFDKNNITQNQIIIKGNSFDNQHPEIKKALELGLEVKTYLELVNDLMQDYYTICIAGTHGKTTTTGMVECVFNQKEKTGFLIGDGHGYLEKDAFNFIVESCEYQDNFLKFHPQVVLINNIELDHVDYFHSLEQYIDSFKKFALQASDFVVLNGDDKNILEIEKQANFHYFGLEDHNEFQAKNINFNQEGVVFDLYVKNDFKYHFKLNLFGEHMLMNALACISIYCLKTNDYDYQYLEERLNDFKGVSRRFEIVEQDSNIFIDDYAHHPTAIKLMIETTRQKYPDKKVVAFFKPDRYSRIAQFKQEIIEALNTADEVYLFDFPLTSKKEEGIEIKMSDLLPGLDNGYLIDESMESIKRFKDYENTSFLLMSSKNVYDFKEDLRKSLI